MNDVARLVLEAWEKLGPGILGDSDELNRRLARRRMGIMTRPPRAWCLALRACDRRITAMDWILTPMHALDLNHPEHPYEPIEHTVTIQPHGLRKFCRPVRTDSWGEQVADVCKQLGASARHLLHARHAGLFTQRIVRGLGGKKGKNVPLIHSWTTLDPSAKHFARPDPLWGALWEFLPDMIPDDFQQTIVRKPVFSPLKQKNAPPDHLYNEECQFFGWRWVCPSCKKLVRKIYYPLPPQSLFDTLGYDPANCQRSAQSKIANRKSKMRFLPFDLHKLDPPPATFACTHCHGVSNGTRCNNTIWNLVVTHLTRGMLYGHEVDKPHWYRRERKRTRSRILDRPSPRREAVFVRLSNGWSIQQIARDLLMHKLQVERTIRHICKQERVKGRAQLAAKLGWKHPQPLNARELLLATARHRENLVQPLLLDGLTYDAIVHQTALTMGAVLEAVDRIYKKHGLQKSDGRTALAEKIGVPPPKLSRWQINASRLKSKAAQPAPAPCP